MPAKETTFDIDFDLDTAGVLLALAKEKNISVSNIVNELIQEALDDREDRILSAIAAARN